jgi:Resolvase, N terminal domain
VLKDAQRRRFDFVMAWAIDRLGRSLIDLLGTIQQWRLAVSIYTSTSRRLTRPRVVAEKQQNAPVSSR